MLASPLLLPACSDAHADNAASRSMRPSDVATIDESASVLSALRRLPDADTFADLAASMPAAVFTQAGGLTVLVPADGTLSKHAAAALLDDPASLAGYMAHHISFGTKQVEEMGGALAMADGSALTVDPVARTIGGVPIVDHARADNGVVLVLDGELPTVG